MDPALQDGLGKLKELDRHVDIDVRIPYLPGGKLGDAYNAIMENTHADWVLFLDHDVFLLNPNWYKICVEAILSEPGCGWFTCWTNRIKHPGQLFMAETEHAKERFFGSDIKSHKNIARKIWENPGPEKFFDLSKGDPCSGFFMLANKAVWEDVGGFVDGFLGVDNEYFKSLRDNGYKILRINSLYVYHHYDRTWTWEEEYANEPPAK